MEEEKEERPAIHSLNTECNRAAHKSSSSFITLRDHMFPWLWEQMMASYSSECKKPNKQIKTNRQKVRTCMTLRIKRPFSRRSYMKPSTNAFRHAYMHAHTLAAAHICKANKQRGSPSVRVYKGKQLVGTTGRENKRKEEEDNVRSLIAEIIMSLGSRGPAVPYFNNFP